MTVLGSIAATWHVSISAVTGSQDDHGSVWSRFRTRFVLLEACSDGSPNRRVESIDPDGFVHSRSGEPLVDLGFHARDDETDAVPPEISRKVPERHPLRSRRRGP